MPGDIRIGGRDAYLDYHNNPHFSQREMWEANAAIEEMAGREHCQRMLDEQEQRRREEENRRREEDERRAREEADRRRGPWGR